MKKFYFLLLIVFAQFGFSQAPLAIGKAVPVPYETVETQPEFPGGMAEFSKFIAKNFVAPELENSGDIVVSFIIEVSGAVIEAKIVKDLGNGSGQEARRVVLMSPKWKPGEIAGKPVRVQYTLPIKIR